MDMVALANVVEMDIVYPCSGTKTTGSAWGLTYTKNETVQWKVEAVHSYSGMVIYATVNCTYNNGVLGIGKKDSCQIVKLPASGICCFAGVQCGGAMKFTNTVTEEISSTASVSHDADDATYRIAFGSY